MVHPRELLSKDGLRDLEEVRVGRDDAVVGRPAGDEVGVVIVVVVMEVVRRRRGRFRRGRRLHVELGG